MTTTTDRTAKAQEKYATEARWMLLGKRVTEVRPLTAQERADLYWDEYSSTSAIAIVFDDGTTIIPSRDDEGNGAGVLFYAKMEKVLASDNGLV